MRPITRLPLISLRTREFGTPFKGVRWVKLPVDRLFKLGEKIRMEISYSPPISDEYVDGTFETIAGTPNTHYGRVTNSNAIWEITTTLDFLNHSVGELKTGIETLYMGVPGINFVTCEVYGAGPPIEWAKWLLIGGGFAVGGMAIGYTLKK